MINTATFWLSGVAIGLCSCLATAIGVGGGGTFLPILIGVLGLTPHKASRLTPACVFGGATGAFILNARKKDPKNPARPLIDTNAILILSPMQAAGTGVGVLLNSLIPPWFILLMALITVLLCLRVTLLSTIKHWIHSKTDDNQATAALFVSVPSSTGLDNDYTMPENSTLTFDPPYIDWLEIIILWIINGTIGFLRGGATGGLVEKRTVGWYVVVGLGIVFSVSCGITAALRRFHRATVWGKEINDNTKAIPLDILSVVDENTLRFTKPVLLKILPATFIAGAIASALGIGGGMFLGPIMLAGGMDPLNVAATTITLIFFSSSLTVLGFAAGGQFNWSLGSPLFLICLMSSLAGKSFVDGVIRKYRDRKSVV